MLLYSVVIPAHNEEGNIAKLIERLYITLDSVGNFEVIIVNDASTDSTFNILKSIKNKYNNLYIVNLKKRCGQSGALYVGLKYAKAPVIITMDADLQNPPEEIPKLISKLQEGYDFVIGVRKNRNDSFVKKFSSQIANWCRRTFLGDDFKDIGCSFRVFKREVLNCIFPFKSLHRFLPYLAFLAKFKIFQTDVKHSPRLYGVTKYGVWKRFVEGIFDLKIMYWLKRRCLVYKELFNESNIEFI